MIYWRQEETGTSYREEKAKDIKQKILEIPQISQTTAFLCLLVCMVAGSSVHYEQKEVCWTDV